MGWWSKPLNLSLTTHTIFSHYILHIKSDSSLYILQYSQNLFARQFVSYCLSSVQLLCPTIHYTSSAIFMDVLGSWTLKNWKNTKTFKGIYRLGSSFTVGSGLFYSIQVLRQVWITRAPFLSRASGLSLGGYLSENTHGSKCFWCQCFWCPCSSLMSCLSSFCQWYMSMMFG